MIGALNKYRIAVALSSYNGEGYITEQINSVFAQTISNIAEITLFVRDDGSADETCHIIHTFENMGHVVLYRGNNIGVCASFLNLLQDIPLDYDFVALCDQDDVWHPDKLARAIDVLTSIDRDIPLLYCSDYIFCDADLHPVHKSNLNKSGISFEKLLFENVCSGNTMVMNHTLHALVASFSSEGVYCHDWWIALIASALGEVHFDRHFYSLDYRRIGSNVSPTGSDIIKVFRYRMSKFIKDGELKQITEQLQKLANEIGNRLDSSKCHTLNRFLKGNRLDKAFAGIRLRQTISGELMLRLLFLFGWL